RHSPTRRSSDLLPLKRPVQQGGQEEPHPQARHDEDQAEEDHVDQVLAEPDVENPGEELAVVLQADEGDLRLEGQGGAPPPVGEGDVDGLADEAVDEDAQQNQGGCQHQAGDEAILPRSHRRSPLPVRAHQARFHTVTAPSAPMARGRAPRARPRPDSPPRATHRGRLGCRGALPQRPMPAWSATACAALEVMTGSRVVRNISITVVAKSFMNRSLATTPCWRLPTIRLVCQSRATDCP